MQPRWIIGLASGSSADGVDAVLLEVAGCGLELRVQVAKAAHQPYGRELHDLLLRLGAPGVHEVRQVSLVHRLLGETFAAAARQVADRASFSLQRLQCIGCPGHHLWHATEGRFPSSLAVGMPAVVAERTGVTVVSDFRARDVAAGGQGVPVGVLVDHLLLRDPEETRLLLHLGGMARATYLPAGGRIPETRGFVA